ncbi:unnamed protein product [Cuscuta europaea]|uniref:Biotin carboxyl carrier protein of acetyl-CoA carboxylase n=1 Tax=Cuscuta europaea TaxID=41803 RepID=A0A9P0YVT6_CUSEU|nr:unnamed protein product [Cuscuta europaea]
MASNFNLHAAKTATLLAGASPVGNRPLVPHQNSVSFRSGSRSGPALLHRLQMQGGFKVLAQSGEVSTIEVTTNSKPVIEEKDEEIPKIEEAIPNASSISAFMSQAAHLVQLVDSRDIVELQLKQHDCEIIIRKKEALPQQQQQIAASAAPVVWQQPAVQQAPVQPQPPPAPTAQVAEAARALPPPSNPKSSHPPFKCPMSGTFYRSPAPGEAPFVKVGDKVSKGQTLCIIEAMKLMNTIEADHAGTVVEIHAEDGKPVSLDTPLFTIAPSS